MPEWLCPGATIPRGDPGRVAPGRDRSRSPVRGIGVGARRSASADPIPESGRGCFITGVHRTGLLEGTLSQLPDPVGLGHAPTFTTHMAAASLNGPPSTNWDGVAYPKTAEKIPKGHFVDMVELLPDAWCYEDAAAQLPIPCHPAHR
uniref:Uncharacterized protein n=1 Tax=Amphimedon queenslandica TaxID=400682 RepID=A0A1X7V6J2_AMPQE